MFKKVKLEGNWWAVFIVNPTNEKDRYMVTSTLKESEADHFLQEFLRLWKLTRQH